MQKQAPFEAYRGSEPYIFVSYAHADADLVYPILERLRANGWRIWYDEGIDPGNEWAAFIENALTGCQQFICFISARAVESLNVRQEINLAIDDRKPFLALHLEDSELKYGLRLRMSAFQALMKYQIQNDEAFLRALERGLNPGCKGDTTQASETPVPPPPPASLPPKRRRLALVLSLLLVMVALVLGGSVALLSSQPAPVEAPLPPPTAEMPVLTGDLVVTSLRAGTIFLDGQDRGKVVAQGQLKLVGVPVGPHKLELVSLDGQKQRLPKVDVSSDKPVSVSFRLPEGFVQIGGGEFTMGHAEDGQEPNSVPLHQVKVGPMVMAARVVTQAQWSAVMETTQAQQREKATFIPLSLNGEGPNYPVYYVNWFEAIEYCNRLSLKEGKTPAYQVDGKSVTWDRKSNGYRLPTEAEWEFAAKGGPASREYRLAGSDIADEVAWYGSNSGFTTHEVGQKKSNSLGLYDMNGNVSQWCWDWYDRYPKEGQTDPSGPAIGTQRVWRGGSWNDPAEEVSIVYRNCDAPDLRRNDLGFRVVLPISD